MHMLSALLASKDFSLVWSAAIERSVGALYVDNSVGAAGSTGRGEANIISCGSFVVVESMRQGKHPKPGSSEVRRGAWVRTCRQNICWKSDS